MEADKLLLGAGGLLAAILAGWLALAAFDLWMRPRESEMDRIFREVPQQVPPKVNLPEKTGLRD